MGRRCAIRTLNFKQVSYESGTLHNHCSGNLELNSKDNSEYAVLCSLLRGSTDFFFWLSMGRRWAITTLNFKEVSYESGNLHNHSSDNLEPLNLKKSAMEVLFSLTVTGIYTVSYTLLSATDAPLTDSYTFLFNAPAVITTPTASPTPVVTHPIIPSNSASSSAAKITVLVFLGLATIVALFLVWYARLIWKQSRKARKRRTHERGQK